MREDKILKFEKEARQGLFDGVELLARAVTTTLGPKGRNVAIMPNWGVPFIVHDGVTVAREVGHKDEFKLMGIELIKQAAQKTNDEAGDGTTTVTLLAYELIKGGMKLVDEGLNPMVLRTQLEVALSELLKELDKISTPVKKKDEIERVATVSSGDGVIGKMVADAIRKVGDDGLVTVEEGKTLETEVEFTEGMEFDKGYLSHYFVTNPRRMEAVIESPSVAIVNRKISTVPELQKVLEPVFEDSKDLVLIANDVSGDALLTLVQNKIKGNFNALAVKAPQGGVGQIEHFLEDLAVVTGGKVINGDKDITPDKSWIGKAEKVIANKDSTVIVRGMGEKKDVEDRVKDIKGQIEEETNIHLKEGLEERLAKLTRGVGVIKVGAKTEVDMREKVERVKDAVGAATSAREEGVVVGGGTAFLRLKKAIDGQNEGERLLKSVLEAPSRKLMLNAGESNEIINQHIKDVLKEGGDWGYEVNSGEMVHLIEKGIIDPTKVIRLTLENAVAVAKMILTTDVLIAIDLKKAQEKLKAQGAGR